jgi:hypothetical protein
MAQSASMCCHRPLASVTSSPRFEVLRRSTLGRSGER